MSHRDEVFEGHVAVLPHGLQDDQVDLLLPATLRNTPQAHSGFQETTVARDWQDPREMFPVGAPGGGREGGGKGISRQARRRSQKKGSRKLRFFGHASVWAICGAGKIFHDFSTTGKGRAEAVGARTRDGMKGEGARLAVAETVQRNLKLRSCGRRSKKRDKIESRW